MPRRGRRKGHKRNRRSRAQVVTMNIGVGQSSSAIVRTQGSFVWNQTVSTTVGSFPLIYFVSQFNTLSSRIVAMAGMYSQCRLVRLKLEFMQTGANTGNLFGWAFAPGQAGYGPNTFSRMAECYKYAHCWSVQANPSTLLLNRHDLLDFSSYKWFPTDVNIAPQGVLYYAGSTTITVSTIFSYEMEFASPEAYGYSREERELERAKYREAWVSNSPALDFIPVDIEEKTLIKKQPSSTKVSK
jgi:hypothetical protein